MLPKTYEGFRRGTDLTVIKTDNRRRMLLNPANRILNYSKTFEWGYCTQGSSQLAIAIIFDLTRSVSLTIKTYKLFQERVIAKLEPEYWILKEQEIKNEINKILDYQQGKVEESTPF